MLIRLNAKRGLFDEKLYKSVRLCIILRSNDRSEEWIMVDKAEIERLTFVAVRNETLKARKTSFSDLGLRVVG